MRELDWQNDCFLQRCLGGFQTSNVIPTNIGFLTENGASKPCPQFLGLCILVVLFLPAQLLVKDASEMMHLLSPFTIRCTIGTHRALPFLLRRANDLLQALCANQVLFYFALDQLL